MHYETLPPGARALLAKLSRRLWSGEFYLAGGTALALQLGHRISVDFDLFAPRNRLTGTERQRIKRDLFELDAGMKLDMEEDRTLKVVIDGIAVSLFHYPNALVAPSSTSLDGLELASLEDIGLMKLAAVIGRGRRRDFIDLYFILRTITLARLLELGPRKFPTVRDFALQAARALVYFADADSDRQPRMLEPVEWPVVKEFFTDGIARLGEAWFERDKRSG